MFAPSYFAPVYFAPRYFPPGLEDEAPGGPGGGGGRPRVGRILRTFPEIKKEIKKRVRKDPKLKFDAALLADVMAKAMGRLETQEHVQVGPEQFAAILEEVKREQQVEDGTAGIPFRTSAYAARMDKLQQLELEQLEREKEEEDMIMILIASALS